jgi:Cys-tRNA(Pro)/Cys-tRNA(Cys) deacylase
MQKDQTQVTLALSAKNLPYRLFTHPGPIHSLEQAAEERGQRPEQVVRSILFRLGRGEYIMVLVAGPDQVSWKALRQYLGQSRISMAKREEVLQVTGYELGAVSPFGLPTPLRTLVDQSVLEEEELSIGSGRRGTTVIIKESDLRLALGDVEIVQLKEEKTS